ncbi:hypothetical protein HZS_6044 [Henneguya salminicola]|nr:hypothetical protein HZS_6044 [Henneguya salminicola]
MILQRINFLHTISSDATHTIIPQQYKITGAPTFTNIPPPCQFLKFSTSCLLYTENTTLY